jgi:peroxiredoxin
MSQGQIAGGSVTQQDELPSKGHRLRDFELATALGGVIRLSDYRGRANLVLLVSDDRPGTAKLLADSAARYQEIKNEDAEVLAIVHKSRQSAAEMKQRQKLPYLVLADSDGRIHRELGAIDSKGQDSAAAYVTDRFGEVFGAYRTAGGGPLPGIAEILNWLEFVNAQCPECEPPEWPV